MGDTSHLAVSSVGEVSTASLSWSRHGQLHATVILKARFQLSNGRAELAERPPIHRRDLHRDGNPLRSLLAPSDLVPYRAYCDVWLVGHAYAPPGQPVAVMPARLAIYQGHAPVLDKTIHVYGDRQSPEDQPRPFQRMALTFERAWGGAEVLLNPVGTGGSAKSPPPNLVDRADPRAVACFGPLPAIWRNRAFALSDATREQLRALPLTVPDALDWHYFQAAPSNQRISLLRGDEWIVLDGLHPAVPRVQSQLPSIRGQARAWSRDASAQDPGYPIELVADTLAIDSDEQTVTVTWRGSFPLRSEEAISTLRVAAGLAMEGREPEWSYGAVEWGEQDAGGPAEVPESGDLGATAMLSPENVKAALGAMPFAIAPPGERAGGGPASSALPFAKPKAPKPPEAPPPAAGLPFAKPPAPKPPQAPPPPATGLPFAKPPVPEPPEAPPPIAGTAASAEPSTPQSPDVPAQTHPPRPASDASTADAGQNAPTFHALPFQKASPEPKKGAPPPPAAVLPFESSGGGPPQEDEARGDIVPPVTLSSLQIASLPWQVKPPQPSLTVIVKGTFDLLAGAEAELREESEYVTGDLPQDGELGHSIRYPSDLAILKPRCDVTVVGTAHHPEGAGEAMEVGFRLGDGERGFLRRLAVWGNRRWGRLAATAPEKFERMPLTFERAFGGAGHDKNPHGLGASADRAGVRPLPNVEDPAALIGSPSDAPAPACMAPVPMAWRHARAHLGSYDDRWLKERWPYFPEDFDYRFFQQAPAEQQLDELVGDEAWKAWGMRPNGEVLEGRLPRLVVRCFAKKLERHGGTFEEVRLRLDTCNFDFDELCVNLVWRGLLDVTDQYASELAALYVIAEPMEDEPLPLERVASAYRAARAALEQVDDEPEAEAETAALRRAEQERAEALRAALPFARSAEPPPEPPRPNAEAVRSHLEGAGASEAQIAAAVAAISASPPEGPAERLTRQGVETFLAAGGDISAIDLSGVDLSQLDLRGVILVDAELAGARLAGSQLGGANLGGANLSGANLDDADLTQADLQGAKLASASLVRSVVADADMTGVLGDDANFREASGAGCVFAEGSFKGAQFQGASLEGADFTEASLDGASFEDAKLPEIRLYDAEGEGVSFERADLSDARADGAKLPGVRCERVLAGDSIWTGAELDGATFAESRLAGASFERASCIGVIFGRCDLREGRFKEATLTRALFIHANLMKSDFEGADLSEVDARKANLHGCEMWQAKLSGAKLEGALITETKLASPS